MKTFLDWFRCAVDETTKFAKLLNKKASNLRLLLRRYRIDDQGPSKDGPWVTSVPSTQIRSSRK
jgi:hypothetical protein